MARGNKFGTFGGVFTPSVLTILGVIMYLRLPWIVGQAGLIQTIGIIVVAHVISVTTGLSVSSIATNKTVHAGGPYYIVSRSLGLPLGGTLGLALFVGIAFSISLYVIGFSESFLAYWDIPRNHDTIRLCGSVTLVVLTFITLVSTSLAIKTQYVILLAIIASLVAIFFAPGEPAPGGLHLDPLPGAPPMEVFFGIFFPAVTGFTAGVNLSGDLKDPKRSLPRGTMAAIVVGLFAYIGLATFLAWRIEPEALVNNPQVLPDMAWHPSFVIAGVWGATLSSALGSLLGAPRILQALSLDRITPRLFGRGHGKTNEPRTAMVLVFIIAEAGILIGELNVIARIVSMFFIMTYGFLNLSCAIERWASTDFRPDFKIPGFVPLLGSLTCVLIMIQLDAIAMVAATTLMIAIFLYLQRRELSLESGDTWEGVWSLVVRSGLQRLNRGTSHPRNWSPNVLLFDHPSAPDTENLKGLGQVLISRRGVLTEFELVPGKKSSTKSRRQEELAPDAAGIFRRRIECEETFGTIAAICHYHGFSGIEPNTVLMGWSERQQDPPAFRALLETLEQQDLNLLLLAGDQPATRERIDIWWGSGTASDQLALLVARFLTTSDDWRRVPVRFLVVNDSTYRADALIGALKRLLGEMRIHAEIEVVGDAAGTGDRAEIIRQESEGASLTVLPVSRRPWDDASLNALVASLSYTLLIRGAPSLHSLTPNLELSRAELPSPTDPSEAIAPLVLPSVGILGEEVARFDKAHQAFIVEVHDRLVAPIEAVLINAVDDLRKVALRALGPLDKSVGSTHATRRRKAVSRAQSAFLFQSSRRVQELQEQEIDRCLNSLKPYIDDLGDAVNTLSTEGPTTLDVIRDDAAYIVDDEDSRPVAAVKRRQRRRVRLASRPVPYRVSVGRLRRHVAERETLKVVQEAFGEMARGSYRLSWELVALMGFVRQRLANLSNTVTNASLTTESLALEREAIMIRFDELLISLRARLSNNTFSLHRESRRLVQTFGDELNRLDIEQLIRKERQVARGALAEWGVIGEHVEAWHTNLSFTLRRVALSVSLGAFHQRLSTVVDRARSSLVETLERDAIPDYVRVVDALEHWSVEEDTALPEIPAAGSTQALLVDERQVMDAMVGELYELTNELPERLETLGELAMARLSEDPFEEGEVKTLDVRRRVEVQLEGALIGALREAISQTASSHQRALSVARDVVRLIGFDAARAAAEDDLEGAAAQREASLEQGVERVRVELAALRTQATHVDERFRGQLKSVVERTGPHAVLSSLTSGTASEANSLWRWLPTFSKTGRVLWGYGRSVLVDLLYRRSAGVLLARKLQGRESRPTSAVDEILSTIRAHVPNTATVEALPFYYQQLFLGSGGLDPTLWIEREEAVAAAKRAVEAFRQGFAGALVVTGERSGGKSSLSTVIATEHARGGRVHHIYAPAGGTVDLEVFDRTMQVALRQQGTSNEGIAALPAGTALVLHDIEMWWERRPGGTLVLERLLQLIEDHGARVLFILNLNIHAFRFIDRLLPLSDRALAVLECGPLDASELRDAIIGRHTSTGLRFQLDGRDEQALGDWRRARLFSRYFDYARGSIGIALRAWMVHIQAFDDDVLVLEGPKDFDHEVFYRLRPPWIALVIELILHREVTLTRLRRLVGIDPQTADSTVRTLQRMGLVTVDRQQVVCLDPTAQHMLVEHLRQRGMLS
jgi:amino acid transporter